MRGKDLMEQQLESNLVNLLKNLIGKFVLEP